MGQHGFSRANYSKAAIGIGLQFHLNRFIATLSYNQTTKENEQSSFVTEVDYRSTSFNFGYSLLKNQWYSIYPYAGFKGTGLHYLYREKATDTTSFDAYLQESINYKEIGNSRGHLDLGIGLSHQWFYLINFRFGYMLPLEKVGWNTQNNTTLPNSPAVTYNYYFTLTIGLGNVMSDNDFQRRNNR